MKIGAIFSKLENFLFVVTLKIPFLKNFIRATLILSVSSDLLKDIQIDCVMEFELQMTSFESLKTESASYHKIHFLLVLEIWSSYFVVRQK